MRQLIKATAARPQRRRQLWRRKKREARSQCWWVGSFSCNLRVWCFEGWRLRGCVWKRLWRLSRVWCENLPSQSGCWGLDLRKMYFSERAVLHVHVWYSKCVKIATKRCSLRALALCVFHPRQDRPTSSGPNPIRFASFGVWLGLSEIRLRGWGV